MSALIQVHYLLGYEKKEFVLNRGQALEIKIDYGVEYETIRIKNGYSRVDGATLARLKEDIRNEDIDFIHQCKQASLEAVDKHLAFLETFVEEQRMRRISPKDEARQRALFVTILSVTRMGALYRVAGQDGDIAAIKKRALSVLRSIVSVSPTSDPKDLFANDRFRPVLREQLQVNALTEFLERLQDICGRAD